MNTPLRIIYAGTPEFAVAALQAVIASGHDVVAVYTQPDRPAGRGRSMQASPVKQKAQEYGLPVIQPDTLKDTGAIAKLRSFNADLMVVVAYGLILPAEVLGIPRYGCINIHASLLPRWRGAAPVQRAILAGDTSTGISIMQMDEGLDTGDILAVTECEITAEDTGASLHDKLMVLGAETLISLLPAIASQDVSGQVLQRTRQNDAEACYAPKLTKAEAKINWSLPAAVIQRSIRAYNDWPVAYCQYEKNGSLFNLRIWQAEIISDSVSTVDDQPGRVLAESAEGIDVLTGDGLLRITRLQPEGKRNMPVSDFLNANSLLAQILK